jgi:hypothetical protein
LADAPETERIESPPASLWDRIRAEPQRAPEHIALAAAERFAPEAGEWSERMRPRYEPDALARRAVSKHAGKAMLSGGVTGLGGALTAAPDVAAVVWIQSRMVFHVAAALGYDPRHPMRPAELLALQGVYQTPLEAREALDGVGTPLVVAVASSALDRDRQLMGTLVRMAGRKLAKRTVLKWVPLISSPLSAAQNADATRALGHRAVRYYGG